MNKCHYGHDIVMMHFANADLLKQYENSTRLKNTKKKIGRILFLLVSIGGGM